MPRTESYATLVKFDPITGSWFNYRDFATADEALSYAQDRTIFYSDYEGMPLRYRIETVTEYCEAV